MYKRLIFTDFIELNPIFLRQITSNTADVFFYYPSIKRNIFLVVFRDETFNFI